MPQFIDYSQYAAYQQCPWKWYERYVRGLELPPYDGRSNSSRTIGSLFHEGIAAYYRTGTPDISQSVIDAHNAAPEAVVTARLCLERWLREYATEAAFVTTHIEEPIRADLPTFAGSIPILAKIDTYGEVPPDTYIYSGDSLNERLYLQPGYWIIEHKTKSAEQRRDIYSKSWQTNKQADFQILALQYHLQAPVQGLIVNVVEKPRNSPPRRKCKGCGTYCDYSSYLPDSASPGKYCCPLCGHTQSLTPLGVAVNYSPETYRLIVTRAPEVLRASISSIDQVFDRMCILEDRGWPSPWISPTYSSCVHPFYGPCDYFEPHSVNVSATEGNPFVVNPNPLQYCTLLPEES